MLIWYRIDCEIVFLTYNFSFCFHVVVSFNIKFVKWLMWFASCMVLDLFNLVLQDTCATMNSEKKGLIIS
jgi:hypothetical protein